MAAKRKRRRNDAPRVIMIALIAAIVVSLVYIALNYTLVLGTLFPKGEPIDLRGRSVSVRKYDDIARRHDDVPVLWDVPIGEGRYDCLSAQIAVGDFAEKEVENFAYLTALRSVDARAASNVAAIRELERAYPELDVSWLIPIGAGRYENKAEEIAVGDFSMEEIERFSWFENLKRVDATQAACYDEILALRETYGDLELKWKVRIGSESFPHTTKELSVPAGTAAEELAARLRYLPDVRMVDTTAAQYDAAALKPMREAYPKVRFLFKVTIAGQSIRNNTENINIPESAALDLEELKAHGEDFSDLKIINLGARHMSLDDVIAIREAYGGVEVICRVTVCGRELSTDIRDGELDLSRRKIEDLGEVEKAIRAIPKLEKIYLCDCGIDNETLAALRDKYAGQTEIVWRVYLNYVDCRTDSDNFCMSKYDNSWGNLPYERAEPIKYCTNMVTLDLGHANFDRIDFVTTMPHLKYFIFCSAPVKSLEPLRNATELYYLEMFFTAVRDLEPIQHLPNLRHLNISHLRLDDYTQLFEMKQLERLWWVDSGLTEAQQNELREALPDTKICFWAWEDDAVGNYWRDDPSYREMRTNLGMNFNVIA